MPADSGGFGGGLEVTRKVQQELLSRTFFDCTPHQAAQQPLDKIQLLRLPRAGLQLHSININPFNHASSEINTSPPLFPFSIEVLQLLTCTRNYDSVIPHIRNFSSSPVIHTPTPHPTYTTNNHHGSRCWY